MIPEATGRLLATETETFFDALNDAVSTPPSGMETFAYIGAGLAAYILLRTLVRIFGSSGKRKTPPADYLTLAVDALGLSEQDRRDLKTLAQRGKPTPSARMLVSPRNLASVLRDADEYYPDAELKVRVANLCTRLFGEPLPDPRFLRAHESESASAFEARSQAAR